MWFLLIGELKKLTSAKITKKIKCNMVKKLNILENQSPYIAGEKVTW